MSQTDPGTSKVTDAMEISNSAEVGGSSAPSTTEATSQQFASSSVIGDIAEKANKPQPKDALVMQKILESMGIEEYEPKVVEQLLELIYRYISDVIVDANVYMSHANREELDLEDIRLAIQSKVNYSFTEPPPVEFLLELAAQKNSMGLLLPDKPCVLLPPEKYCLTNPNYQVIAKKRKSSSSDPKRRRVA